MPIDSLSNQKFQHDPKDKKLLEFLNPQNKLVRLRDLIDWEFLEKYLEDKIEIHKLGRI